MKSLGKISQALAGVAAMACLLFAINSQAAANNQTIQGHAEVKLVKGEAFFTSNGKTLPLLKGISLNPGDSVTTGTDGKVELDLGENGQELVIIENTTLNITKLEINKTGADTVVDTELDLKKGGVVGNVKKISAASQYNVKYAKGVAGIRGTEYAIMPNESVVCLQGTVTVTFIVGGVASTVTIGRGQTASPPTTPGGAVVVAPTPDATKDQIARGQRGTGEGHGDNGGGVEIVKTKTVDPTVVLSATN